MKVQEKYKLTKGVRKQTHSVPRRKIKGSKNESIAEMNTTLQALNIVRELDGWD